MLVASAFHAFFTLHKASALRGVPTVCLTEFTTEGVRDVISFQPEPTDSVGR
jgi:hypothetical protein